MTHSDSTALPAAAGDIIGDAASASDNTIEQLRRAILLRVFPASAAKEPARNELEQRLAEELANLRDLGAAAKESLQQILRNELFGLGPIQSLLDDPTVTEIMVNRADRVYAERKGKPTRTNIVFDDDAHVRRMIDRIIQPLGRRVDEDNPVVDARLPDGSRVNAVVPPVAIAGPCITIRKFSKARLSLEDLAGFGTMTPAIAEFLRGCVLARMNIIVAGGTGSGKTTLLNALSGCIPDDERIVTIEDAAELKLCQDHVITLEAKRPNADGTGECSIRDLVRNALRMRPERIVVGECRGGETLDMLQAMNTGHDGSLTTLHANSPRDAISRIETMSLMAGIDFPIRVIREQIGSAIQLIIQQARLRDGSRKITSVTEIAGMEGEKVVLQELFRFREEPGAADGKVNGSLFATGLRSHFMPKLDAVGVRLPQEIFSPSFAGGAAKARAAA